MKVKLISYSTPSIELENDGIENIQELISFCARVSNPSNQINSETSDKLLKYLIKNKHWSPLEMANICLEITTTRDIARQILRHRSFSFQEFCLSGDTNVSFENESHIYKLSELYNEWVNNCKIIQSKLIKCYDEEQEKLITTTIKDIFYTGKKEVYKITLSDDKIIKSTKEHKYLTKNGFLPLEEIVGLNNFSITKESKIAVNSKNFNTEWVYIKHVEYIGEEHTYDIEVNHKSHNYVANDIIVHNSQRYANPVEDLSFELREARLQDLKNRQNSIDINDNELQNSWEEKQQEVIDKAKEVYCWAIEKGIAKEQARCVLPEGNIQSRMYVNGTLRSWIHYCEIRSDNGTQKEHMEIAKKCAEVISKLFPMIKK